VIIPLNRVSASAAVPDGGSDGAVITAKRVEPVLLQSVPPEPANLKAVNLKPVQAEAVQAEAVQAEAVQAEAVQAEAVQLELSCRTGADGNQVISVTGELDIATAEQAYAYISEVIDSWPMPISVDLSGLTFCDASGLGVFAKIARHARQAGRQPKLTSVRPSLLKIMRLTGLDGVFPELRRSRPAYSALAAGPARQIGAPWTWRIPPASVKFGVLPALNQKVIASGGTPNGRRSSRADRRGFGLSRVIRGNNRCALARGRLAPAPAEVYRSGQRLRPRDP
jgi:anti-sigma B factor antagonist